MAHITADRVRQTSTSIGTGSIVLSGSLAGFRDFSAVLAVNDTFWYSIASYPGSEWEVGLGTYTSASTFTRTTVLSSSNAGAAVTFSAGTKEVFITAAASKFLQADAAGNYGVGTSTVTNYGSTYTTLAINNTAAGVLDLMANGVSQFRLFGNGSENRLQGATNAPMTFFTNNTEKMRLDSAGNFGLGVTPSAWSSLLKAFQFGPRGNLQSSTATAAFGYNSLYDTGGAFRYVNTDFALEYRLNNGNGSHMWLNAPSGTAGAALTLTQAMLLDASGNLYLTATNSNLFIQPASTTSNAYTRFVNAGGTAYVGLDNSVGGLGGAYTLNLWHGGAYPIVFGTNNVERARIDSSGNLGVGTTSPTARLTVDGTVYSASYPINTRLQDSTTAFGTGVGSGISFGGRYQTAAGVGDFAAVGGYKENATDGNYAGYLSLMTRAAGSALLSERVRIDSTGNVVIGATSTTYKLQVVGSFAATTKSFVIDHPTKEGKKLRYGSLEGPENGVYVRGKLSNNDTIELPEYWTKLVEEDSITVNLTPIGKHQKLYVKSIEDNKVIIGNDNLLGSINCFYTIFAERIDVSKLEVEID